VLAAFRQLHDLNPLEEASGESTQAAVTQPGIRFGLRLLESMATLGFPGLGYGLRYEYGVFQQTIQNGWQVEQPDHGLARPSPWEVARLNETAEVKLKCSFEIRGGELRPVPGRPSRLLGTPYDRPAVGYGGETINTVRLWAARPLTPLTLRSSAVGISSARSPSMRKRSGRCNLSRWIDLLKLVAALRCVWRRFR
jgi:starch phosphorylase